MSKGAHEQGCPWDEYTCLNTAKYGNLKCLKYDYEKGCMFNSFDASTAGTGAEYGHLECLIYCFENKCINLNSCHTFIIAASNGKLDCLKYTHENGSLWNTTTYSCAAYHGNLNCLKYLYENECPINI
jgi:hypothetical protein